MSIKYFQFIIYLLAISCTSPTESKESSTAEPYSLSPVKEIVVDQLKRPWSMAFLSEDEVLVTEKDGDLLRLNLETGNKSRITGIPSDVADSLVIFADRYPLGTYPTGTSGFKGRYNAGLLDVLLDPNFETNHWVYLSYASEKDEKYATKVIRGQLKDNELTNVETIMIATPYVDGLFHFGGGLLFGQDNKLYVSVGERLFGDALQPPDMPIAQDYSDKRGKIYRINPDGSIPSDNPDFGDNAEDGIYATGIRNTQGMTMDPRSGNIWFSDHGTIQGDELNLLDKKANFGWPVISSGKYRGGYEPPELDRDFTNPKYFWHHTIAPTGLTFYTGTEFPQWKNNLIIPGLSRGNFWRFVIENNEILSVEELFINDRHRTRKAVQSPEGQLYILTDENDGKIIRIYNKEVTD